MTIMQTGEAMAGSKVNEGARAEQAKVEAKSSHLGAYLFLLCNNM